MKKVYHLSTCNTCKRILAEFDLSDFEQQEIKTEAITEDQLEEMHELAGSYEALFSRRSMQYRKLGLNEKTLNEEDYKNYILEHYSFLKRPVFIVGEDIYIGNSKKVIAKLKEDLGQ
jgi:arsenate reductase